MLSKLAWAASAAQVLLGTLLITNEEFRKGLLDMNPAYMVLTAMVFGSVTMTHDYLKHFDE
jgi:hypothetical protein